MILCYNNPMNKVRAALVSIIFLFFFPYLLEANNRDSFERTAGNGLEINSEPEGARVLIDGIERGITPLTLDDMLPGVYNIELVIDGFKERSFTGVILNNSRLVVFLEMTAGYGIATITVHKETGSPDFLPLNPEIFTRAVDQTVTHVSTLHNNSATIGLPIGNNTITVSAFGWEENSVTIFVNEDTTATVNIYMKPAAFKLERLSQSRRRFNPLNPGNLGITEYRFEVTSPGSGIINISDSNGNIVFIRQLEHFKTRAQFVIWDGRNEEGEPLPQGTYTAVLEVKALPELTQDEDEAFTKQLKTEINYSANIFPLSLDSGIAGLTFAPMPHTLPAGSYQIYGDIIYGTFGMPFKINMRFSPFEHLELTSSFFINPFLNDENSSGLSGSIKYNFLDGNSSALAISAGTSYAWINKSGEYPLSSGKGVSLYIPLSMELEKFSLVFSPAAFWRGPEGLVPQVLLSGGVLYRLSWLTCGLSTRYELNIEKSNYRMLAGAELHIFPPPSIFVLSLKGGIIKNDSTSGYIGIGINLIY